MFFMQDLFSPETKPETKENEVRKDSEVSNGKSYVNKRDEIKVMVKDAF